MGFSSFHNTSPNPAQRYYRWSGGEKKVEINGETVKKLKGELVYWDGETMQSQELPFTFCVLEQTSSVTGFAPKGAGNNVRYYSNEITSFDEPIRVTRRDDNGSEVIADGIYQEVKKNLPQGCKFQTNLYIYNPETQRIERINLKGSALSEYISFGQKNKGIYEHTLTLSVGEEHTNGTVDYVSPKFTMGDKYTNEDMKILAEQDRILVDYLKFKRDANMQGISETDSNGEAIDQTPSAYEGEQSQDNQGETLNLGEIPF